MKVATVLDSSLPVSIIRKQRGIISVDKRKLMTSVSSTLNLIPHQSYFTFTKAPITPKEVSLRDSYGLLFVTVFKKGYRKRGMWAKSE
jgi:hypothetical protein